MQTITKTFNIYKFEELNPIIQKQVIDKWRDKETFEEWQQEAVLEDVNIILGMFGFSNFHVSYTGFYSQGDGARFTGDYVFSANSVENIKEYAPQDATLHEIAQIVADFQAKHNNEIVGIVEAIPSHYCHEQTTIFKGYVQNDEIDATPLQTQFRALMRWIYAQLQETYENWHSEAFIKEEIEAGEYDFLENGQIYNNE